MMKPPESSIPKELTEWVGFVQCSSCACKITDPSKAWPTDKLYSFVCDDCWNVWWNQANVNCPK